MFDQSDIEQATAWRYYLLPHSELGFEKHFTSDMTFGLLPIAEATGLPYTSTHAGKMHACGDDGHPVMLLLAAWQIAREGVVDGSVTLIFQPAEENDGSARVIIEDGFFRDFPLDRVFGIKNWPGLALWRMVVRNDRIMAAFAVFEIEISGRGGHSAMAEQSGGVIATAGAIVGALQAVLARALSPLEPGAASVTQVHSGSAWNARPDKAVLRGTERWFDPGAGDFIQDRVLRVAEAMAQAQGCTASVDYRRRYPTTIIAPAEVALACDAAAELGLNTVLVPPSMALKDFAFILIAVSGAYLWLCAARDGDNHGLHSAKFDFKYKILPIGAELWVRLVRRCLAG